MARSKKTTRKKPRRSKKKPVGRPTKYKPEYGDQLIEHMKKGNPYGSFSYEIDVNTDSLYEWEKHPEFSEAKKKGRAASLQWWMNMGKAGMTGQIKSGPKGSGSFNAAVWIFMMKNLHKWSDKYEHRHGGPDGEKLTITALVKQVSEEEG